MKIHIGANKNNDLLNAKRWLVIDEDCRLMLPEIETWARNQEAYWGECYIFVEVSIPIGDVKPKKMRAQVDMLIAFSNKAVICELKGHTNVDGIYGIRRKLDNYIEQLDSQKDWLVNLFKARRIFNIDIYQFLLAHNLNIDGLEELDKLLVNLKDVHIWIAGASPKLKGQKVGGRSSYLPEALEDKLKRDYKSKNFSKVASPRKNYFQDFFFQEIKKSGGKLKTFDNFSEVTKYLEYIFEELEIKPDEWFVPELRQDSLNEITKSLEEQIIAAEIINSGEKRASDFNFQECNSVIKICNAIWSNDGDEPLEGLGEERYIQRILDMPFILWIKGYDEISANSLNRFFQIVHSKIDLSNSEQSQWLVESQSSITSLHSYSHQVKPLDNAGLSLILDKLGRSGGAFLNPEEVLDRARGNPRKAILLWQSQNSSHVEQIGEVTWFTHQLSNVEKRILSVLCFVISKAPLGITEKNLTKASEKICDDLMLRDIQTAVESLLKKLETYQLANITRFEKDIFDGLLDEILPSDFSLVVINHIEATIIAYGISSFTVEEQRKFIGSLEEIFPDSEGIDTLGFITSYLNYYEDIEPFFRSSFRYTSLGQFIEWIDATGWKPKDKTQSYLLKALRLLHQMRRKAEGEIEDFEGELGLPDTDDEVQRFAYDFVQGRSFVVKKIQRDFDLKSWLKETFTCKDEDLRAAKLVSIIYALHSSKRNEDVWKILPDLPKCFKANSTAKGLAVYTNLEFLNKTTFTKEIKLIEDEKLKLTDDEIYTRIKEHTIEYIKEGLRVENIQAVCDGLYCYSRAQELRKKSLAQYSSVLDYFTVLKYVENAPRTRARQRIKIVLTQGSIFRHYCENNELKWNEFLPAFEKAVLLYSRAFQAAISQRHSMHIGNATSYMMELCRLSLRYYNEPNALDIIAENLEKTIQVVDKVEKNLENLLSWETEENIYSTIRRNFPALLYAHLVSKKFLNENEKDTLQKRVTSCIDGLLKEIESVEVGRERKLAINIIKNFRRVISYANKRSPEQNLVLLGLLRTEFNTLLDETQWLCRDGEFFGQWATLSELINGK